MPEPAYTYSLYEAASFMHRHPELSFSSDDGVTLLVGPGAAARPCREEIKRLKPDLLRLVVNGWSPAVAYAVNYQASRFQSKVLTPHTVETIEFMQLHTPDTWDRLLDLQKVIRERREAEDYAAFMCALCEQMDLYEEGKAAWQAARRKPKAA